MEVRFKDGLDYLAQCLLDHSVFYRRYAKRSFAPILFLDFHPSHRAWLVHIGFQLGMDGGQVLFKTRLKVLHGLPIYAGSAIVGLDVFECQAKVIHGIDFVYQTVPLTHARASNCAECPLLHPCTGPVAS
jgi:hypothetical protein